jgi:hypothetical protein
MQGMKKSLAVAVGVMLLMSVTATAAAQEERGHVAVKAADSASGSGASGPASISSEELSDLKTEIKLLHTLLEQQQEQLAKLKAGAPSSTAPTGPPAPAPAPAPAAAQEVASEEAVRPLRIGGFANWAYGKTNNINEFDLATQHGRYDNIDAGLIVTPGYHVQCQCSHADVVSICRRPYRN